MLQVDFTSDYGSKTKEAKKRHQTYMSFVYTLLQNFEIAYNLERSKISFNVHKLSLF